LHVQNKPVNTLTSMLFRTKHSIAHARGHVTFVCGFSRFSRLSEQLRPLLVCCPSYSNTVCWTRRGRMWSFFARDPTKDFNYEILPENQEKSGIWTLSRGKRKV